MMHGLIGPLLVYDGTRHTRRYLPRTRSRNLYRAPYDDVGNVSAKRKDCPACDIAGSGKLLGAHWCVGAYGGCTCSSR
jgi:hypothetical protein